MCVCVCLHQDPCLTLCDPRDCSPPGSPVGEVPRQEYRSGFAPSFSRGLPDPGIKRTSLASPALAGGFLTNIPSEKSRVDCTFHFM